MGVALSPAASRGGGGHGWDDTGISLSWVGTMSGYGPSGGVPGATQDSRHRRPQETAAATTTGVPVPRRLVSITLDNLDDLPHRCRRCVFWDLDPVGHARAQEVGD